ncbi:Molecular chaperone (DnaJ superfamily) [Trachipleistophora hominis]|uniref:Molecular chaperone (DnaJ superfamily) n=1 Tax=Trachipleistophora hominis TaxID=72359 RepID=L7K0L6_TRAHO|nr:Molecular chaperone (DnaJ superfamily) [Trachipleistophora hominis]
MILFLLLVSTESNLRQNLDLFFSYVDNGQLRTARQVISNLFDNDSSNALVRKKYASFLMELGDYDKVLAVFKDDEKLVGEAVKMKTMLKNLKENVHKIYLKSPFSKPVMVELIKQKMLTNMSECYTLLSKAEMLFKDDDKIIYLRALYHAFRSENQLAHQSLLRSGSNRAGIFKNMCDMYKKLSSGSFRYAETKGLVDKLRTLQVNDKHPSIFYMLLINSLVFLVKNGAEENRKVTEYAELLCKLEKKDDSYVLLIKALLAEGKVKESCEQIGKIKNASLRERTERTIEVMKKKKIEERKRAEEQRKSENKRKTNEEERKRRVEEQRRQEKERKEKQRASQHQRYAGTNTDSKGYYKLLGVEPTATPKDIKARYNKLVLKYDVDRQKVKPTEQEKERLTQKLAMINQARDVLLNPKKRKLYDSGMLDQQGYGGGHAAANNEQVKQMLEAFFGRGGGQSFFFDLGGNQGGYRRSQTFYFV